jgi:cytochrome c oxidase accessory protein FixG
MVAVIDRRKGVRPSSPNPPVSAAARTRALSVGGGLYKKRAPIYPKLAHGRWRTIKWVMLIATLAVYYITPWIRWTRPGAAPDQAVLIDFQNARTYFFWLEFWPQEVYFVTGLLVIAALALFLTSALFGRLWCGYACPQTIWTDLFIHIERLFEGDRNARMRLDAAPWSLNKAARKIGKHAVWLGIAFGTGGAWIFYFRDAPTLLREFWTGQAPVLSYLSCGLLTATTYLFAGTMREQVCIYMCPWPRIQGAMLDQHSLQVTYLRDRGEPRAPHKKNASWEGRGDCIDCGQCVVVCPMGIDIRNGSQLECINCGLCVDACDETMVKVGRPTGLIGYDTDAAVEARASGAKPVYRFVRPRTLFYAGALSLVGGLMAYGLMTRTAMEFHVVRDKNPMFVRMQDGSVRNGYTLRFANRGLEPKTLRLSVDGLAAPTLKTPGQPAASALQVQIPADQTRSVRVFLTAAPPAGPGAAAAVVFKASGPGLTVGAASTFVTGDAR